MDYPDFTPILLAGEHLDCYLQAPITSTDAAVLAFFRGGNEKDCAVIPCALAISQYRLLLGPASSPVPVLIPFLSIEKWSIARASNAVTASFLTARNAYHNQKCHYVDPTTASVAAAASSFVSSSPPQQQQQAPLMMSYSRPPSLFTLSLQSKHVWSFTIVLQSDRVLNSLKSVLRLACTGLSHLSLFPAFEFYRARMKAAQGSADTTGTVAASASPSLCSVSSCDTVEFGWNIYQPRKEFARQLSIWNAYTTPFLLVPTQGDLVAGRIGVGKDLRPWFRLRRLHRQHTVSDGKCGASVATIVDGIPVQGRTLLPGTEDADAAVEDAEDFDDAAEGGSAGCCSTFGASPTYPWLFLEPVAIGEIALHDAIAGRSRSRVPAISFVHLRTGAVLSRASQPLMWCQEGITKDAEVCRAMANSGYPVSGGGVGSSPITAAAISQQQQTQQQQYTSPISPAAAAAAAAAAAVPSLFDDDDDGSFRINHFHSTTTTATVPTVPTVPSSSSFSSLRPAALLANSTLNASAMPAMTMTAASPLSNSISGGGGGGRAAFLLVADCRPWMTAEGNAKTGGGYETGSRYSFCETKFFGIDNVFGVAKSFAKLRALLASYQGSAATEGFSKALHDTQWLQHIQRVLECSVAIVTALECGESCLVHCTDGWDRTSQCCATAMLLIDPFYRTTFGFCMLIEKEFCSFGHKFAERSAHKVAGRTRYSTQTGTTKSDTEQQHELQVSPIFAQYMDVVYQVVRQFPYAFEFTPELLKVLSESVYSCLYGTFLCDCEQERTLEGVRLQTPSLWTDVLRRVQREKRGEAPLWLVNPDYDASTAWKFIQRNNRRAGSNINDVAAAIAVTGGGDGESGEDGAVCTAAASRDDGDVRYKIIPSCNSKRLVFWEDFYFSLDSDRLAVLSEGSTSSKKAARLCNLPVFDHAVQCLPQMGSSSAARTQKVSWGEDFDAYLQGLMDDACVARQREETTLLKIEKVYAHKRSIVPSSSSPAPLVSRWCVFDKNTCFACYKSISMWSSKSRCRSCGQLFCSSECMEHGCPPG